MHVCILMREKKEKLPSWHAHPFQHLSSSEHPCQNPDKNQNKEKHTYKNSEKFMKYFDSRCYLTLLKNSKSYCKCIRESEKWTLTSLIKTSSLVFLVERSCIDWRSLSISTFLSSVFNARIAFLFSSLIFSYSSSVISCIK